MKIEQENGLITYYREDGAPIARVGNISDGRTGIWVAKEKQRIFSMDNVIRYYHYSKEQIKKTMDELL